MIGTAGKTETDISLREPSASPGLNLRMKWSSHEVRRATKKHMLYAWLHESSESHTV